MAPVYINDILLMLAVDTGAAMTMINDTVFSEHFPIVELQKSQDLFHTANGEELRAKGQFHTHV